MDGPPWVLGIDWPMGLPDGWVLGRNGPTAWMGLQGFLGWVSAGQRWALSMDGLQWGLRMDVLWAGLGP